MLCKKCNANFPSNATIKGKRYNLQNRKYCLSCSPFKQHNTKRLEVRESKPFGNTEVSTNEPVEKICHTCGKTMFRKLEIKGKSCWSCTNKNDREKKINMVKNLVGERCWFCDYSKCWNALEFHHVDPSKKLFGLSVREMQFAWHRIEIELKKCVLACACCHREIHCGLISSEQVQKSWNKKWGQLDSNQ